MLKGEGSELKQVILLVLLSIGDFLDLLSDGQKSINISVDFLLIFGLSRLNHETTSNWPRLSWSVESIIHQSLGNINLVDASTLKLIAVKNELVSNYTSLSSVKDLEWSIKLIAHVVGIKDGLLR